MRLLWIVLLGIQPIAMAFCQPAPQATNPPALPKDPQEIFAAARPLYDFSAPSVQPWHMKVSYQLYDNSGKPSDTGTYEYWWAAPDTYRSSWTRPGASQGDWYVKGIHSRASTGQPLTFFERQLQSQFLSPLPRPENLNPNAVQFEEKERSFGSLKLACVMIVPKTSSRKRTESAPLGEFPTYCFSPDRPFLRAYYGYGSTSVIYNKVVLVQGVYLPKEIRVQDGDRLVLTASVNTLEKIPATSADLMPDKDAKIASGPPRIEISSALALGQLLKQVRPIYPDLAKIQHLSGRVELDAVIGTDGRVHDLNAISGPSPSLIGAAMQAVSQWEYKPYLLNGTPVEVETTINVVFNLAN